MSGNTNQKTKILYLMKILMEETDELHPLTIKELVTKLDQYNIQAERKSLYNDIENLRLILALISRRIMRVPVHIMLPTVPLSFLN